MKHQRCFDTFQFASGFDHLHKSRSEKFQFLIVDLIESSDHGLGSFMSCNYRRDIIKDKPLYISISLRHDFQMSVQFRQNPHLDQK
ncbi:MAG TPA: hypothetical protein DEW31_00315 [Alistipes obesi]|nr:hypothetical protein [Alistipes communis]